MIKFHGWKVSHEQAKSGFLRWSYYEGIKMTTNDLQYSVSLVDKAEARFERIDFNFEKSSAIGKM